ncbi:uncharacterized protein FFUJ_14170 [Fusarium fujikuroi IMI 58289]|uniref:Uncharacterized protein n=1 Tax=Gibberella fujikuroi (strain CBS 195.34 / IMI 58289 / NRRL A-6831) TaxID=1279085 RepID=S0ENB4_GIBF5|nr:uncharacterized protein FFUJ_14170 [Fusarium fujikuroi IMI 58289]CCT76197.1 uncharacterized protein FFUJ_14170 [Fusarium fujikuroi IMI 58289]SCO26778.1 uncharacterized protein FFM5_15047 [Fusarium fujikuroi]
MVVPEYGDEVAITLCIAAPRPASHFQLVAP